VGSENRTLLKEEQNENLKHLKAKLNNVYEENMPARKDSKMADRGRKQKASLL
jgi:hypothetical protein